MAIDSSLRDALIEGLTANSQFTYSGTFEINWLDASYTSRKFGGMALYLTEKVNTTSLVNGQLFELLLLGNQAPAYQDLGAGALYGAGDGTQVNYSHTRELKFSYGRRLIDAEDLELAIGFGIKHVWALGYLSLDIAGEQLAGRASFSEFYDKIQYEDALSGIEDIPRRLFGNAGGGFGLDFGANVSKPTVYSIGLAITNLGSIAWDERSRGTNRSIRPFIDSVDTGLIDSYSFDEETNGLVRALGYEPQPGFETPFNTILRLNGSFHINSKVRFSTDLAISLREESITALNTVPSTYAAHLSYRPFSALRSILDFSLTTGVLHAERFGTRVPFGVALKLGNELSFGAAVPDLLTYLGASDQPYAGLSVATLGIDF